MDLSFSFYFFSGEVSTPCPRFDNKDPNDRDSRNSGYRQHKQTTNKPTDRDRIPSYLGNTHRRSNALVLSSYYIGIIMPTILITL